MLTFNAFITKNVDFPFWIKQKVFDAALLSTILYSSAAWLGNSARNAQAAYYSAVKTLLGVRVTAANDLCLMLRLSVHRIIYILYIRADYPTLSFASIFSFFQSNDIGAMCHVVNRTLRVFENEL